MIDGSIDRKVSWTVSEKLTPLLAHRLATSAGTDVLGVELRLDGELTSHRRAALEALGLSIGTVAGSVLTCRGTVEAVRTLAGLDFVVSVDSGIVELF